MRRILLLAFLFGIAMTQTGSTQSKTVEIDLAGMTIGQAPAGFAFAKTGGGRPPHWIVAADSGASGGRAIAQTDTDRTDNRFPLAIYQPLMAKNVEVSARFKPVAGRVDQAAGLVVRLQGPNDYYIARANALEDNVRFYRVVNGRREQLATANLKVASGVWHTLALKAEDDRFTVTFDGRELYTARDAIFAGAGRVALWTKADSVTHFDTIKITPLN
jgi:hypothetical protein